jgi:cell division septation protein DedD
VKALYNKKSFRSEGGRQSFAFFIVGAVVVLVAVFLVGIYFGRELEKGGAPFSDNHAFKTAGEGPRAEWAVQGANGPVRAGDNIQREMGKFSEEAVRVPVVPPGRPDYVPPEQDNALTFQDSLSKEDPEPVPVDKPREKSGPAKGVPPPAKKSTGTLIQAGAFKDKEKADVRLKKVEQAGCKAHLGRSGKDGKSGLYVVLAGPYAEKDAARKAISKLKAEQKIDAIIAK